MKLCFVRLWQCRTVVRWSAVETWQETRGSSLLEEEPRFEVLWEVRGCHSHCQSTEEQMASACSARTFITTTIPVSGKLYVMLCVAGVCLCTCSNHRLDLCWILWSSMTESRLLVLPCEVRMFHKHSSLYQVDTRCPIMSSHNHGGKYCS